MDHRCCRSRQLEDSITTVSIFPQEPYEKLGRITNAVFTCNALVEGENIRIYYGAADAVIGMAEMPLADVLAACHEEYRFFDLKS